MKSILRCIFGLALLVFVGCDAGLTPETLEGTWKCIEIDQKSIDSFDGVVAYEVEFKGDGEWTYRLVEGESDGFQNESSGGGAFTLDAGFIEMRDGHRSHLIMRGPDNIIVKSDPVLVKQSAKLGPAGTAAATIAGRNTRFSRVK